MVNGDATLDMTEKIIGAVGIVVITIVLLAMTPTVVDSVQDMNTTGWNFTGYAGATQLIGLVPFIWIAGILIASAVGMFALAKAPTRQSMYSNYVFKLLRKMGRNP